MNQEIFDWILLLVRWLHITVAVTWIGTSIFFMWLDRTFKPNPHSTREGHVGEVWMVHGGGFYHVEKLLMGPTKVPEQLHWFKWESYWTWLSGTTLIALIFYTGEGTFLLDSSISHITYAQAVALSVFSLIGSWFFYDFVWENKVVKESPVVGHMLTLSWLAMMSYLLCHTLSGRAAYIHIGGMIGTWMTANVFMRIIPRQVLMVEASRRGEPVNLEWGKNAKNRSTHNTYFTLPVIFIMISNHFPSTYGHELNWLLLLVMCAAGAAIREYFVKRIDQPSRAKKFLVLGIGLLLSVIVSTTSGSAKPEVTNPPAQTIAPTPAPTPEPNTAPTTAPVAAKASESLVANIKGVISFEGVVPARKKLVLPNGCNQKTDGLANDILIKNGKLQNVLIRVTKGLEGKTFSEIPTEVAQLDQRGCQYHPRLLAVRVGQKVDFINSDPIFHNIRSITTVNKNFNLPMPKKDQRISMTFDKPEIFMQSKCSVHPWMGAHIAVMDHPYFAVSDEQGHFEIKNLPAGTYTIEAWHEVFGVETKEIKIENEKEMSLDFSFKDKK